MYSYLAFRTLTEAQKGLALLQSRRIPATLARRPSAAGCGYGIRLPERFLESARRVLLNAGFPPGGGTEE